MQVRRTELFIDNGWVKTGKTFEVLNPFDGTVVAKMEEASKKEVDLAVAAGRRAFDDGPWPRMSNDERSAIIRRIGTELEKRKDEFAQLETLNTGKPLVEANADIYLSYKIMNYYSGLAENIRAETMEVSDPNFFWFTTYEPIGLVCVIPPFNFPLHLATRSLAPALAAGNTAIIKPSTLTPLTATLFGEVLVAAGVPPGVVNVVNGPGSTVGSLLTHHPQVDMIAFTGSKDVGVEIQRAAAETMKRTVLELGGKSPAIIFDDADIEQAAKAMLFAFCYNQGEVCAACTRYYVQKGVYGRFLEEFKRQVGKLKLGNGFDPTTQMGPLISAKQVDKTEQAIRKAVKEGAVLEMGGSRPKGGALGKGFFFEPTILSVTRNDLDIVQEEVFGAVAVIRSFDTDEEAIALANDTQYGLAAYIWSRDIKRCLRTYRRIRAGCIWVNSYDAVFMQGAFGGFKMSGIGRDYGYSGLKEFMELKSGIVSLHPNGLDWYGDTYPGWPK